MFSFRDFSNDFFSNSEMNFFEGRRKYGRYDDRILLSLVFFFLYIYVYIYYKESLFDDLFSSYEQFVKFALN